MDEIQAAMIYKRLGTIKYILFAIFGVLLIILLSGCDQGSHAPGSKSFVSKQEMVSKAEDLQRRQQNESWPADIEIKEPSHKSLYNDVDYLVNRLPWIEYVSDQELWAMEDYWETADQVLEKRKSDCEGMANFYLVAINLTDILDYWGAEAMVRILDYGEIGHAVCTIRSDDEIVEISNGWVYNFEDEGQEILTFDLYTIYD